MADFTDARYLGLRHASLDLPGWPQLTLGRPAVLAEPPGALDAAAALACLSGAAAATLLPSTLHLFWDLLRQLAKSARSALLLDAGAYPILHWAADGAVAAGARVQRFAHHDAAALAERARQAVRSGLRPVIVCDGFCTGCNRAAPLADYARIAAASGGLLVFDDTQALGVLGRAPDSSCPYGHGGGGSLRWHGLGGDHIAMGASLAKAFGAPLAVLAGGRELVGRFVQDSGTRMHCSPPPVAVVQAARAALARNASKGELWRVRLLRLVQRLRTALVRAGLDAVGALPFPAQSFLPRSAPAAATLWQLAQRLRDAGVQALLTRGCRGPAPRLSFLVTARHCAADIDPIAALVARG